MPLTKWQPPAQRHDVDEHGRVTWLELFFDLVYVAALIQLGDRLAQDVSWGGAAAFLGVFVVLWWTWTGTTAFTNRYAVDDIVHRVLAFVQMFAVGNLALLAATTPDNWRSWFVVAYLAARLPLLAMYARARRAEPETRAGSDLIVRWFSISLVLWVVSLAVPGSARVALWAVALLLEFGVPILLAKGAGDDAPPSPVYEEHFQERYALFTIIVLGETFVKSLTAIADRGISIETQVLGSLAFLILIALWWTYFDDVADAHIKPKSALGSTPATNRLVWVYTHLPLTAGITAFGVASKKIVSVETFDAYLKPANGWLLIGALSLVLLSVAVLDLVTASPHYAVDAPERVGPRLIATVALLVIGFALLSSKPPGVLTIGLITAVVVAQIAYEVVIAHKSEHRINEHVREVIATSAGSCSHLEVVDPPPIPRSGSCDACRALGQEPVQLRWCLECGHIGCCDDTPGQHARLHFHETGHALLGSLAAGDDWAYCYVDDVSAPGAVEQA